MINFTIVLSYLKGLGNTKFFMVLRDTNEKGIVETWPWCACYADEGQV